MLYVCVCVCVEKQRRGALARTRTKGHLEHKSETYTTKPGPGPGRLFNLEKKMCREIDTILAKSGYENQNVAFTQLGFG